MTIPGSCIKAFPTDIKISYKKEQHYDEMVKLFIQAGKVIHIGINISYKKEQHYDEMVKVIHTAINISYKKRTTLWWNGKSYSYWHKPFL